MNKRAPIVMAITKHSAIIRVSGPRKRVGDPPTTVAYGEFQLAYDFFNKELFDGQLPQCLITLQRRGQYEGFYSKEQFNSATGEMTDEIALNPAYFMSETFEVVMSTLVHEMSHLWQHHFGKPSRSAYHNREWAQKMLWLGLHPTDNGLSDGKMTGQSMTHYIIEGGRFALAVEKLKQETALSTITWRDKVALPAFTPDRLMQLKADREEYERQMEQSREQAKEEYAEHRAEWEEIEQLDEREEEARLSAKGVSGKRTIYRCPKCEDRADGKSSLHLICGKCDRRMIRDGLR